MLPQCGEQGRNLLLDITIKNPAAESLIDHTIRDQDSAIRSANKQKTMTCARRCR